MPDALSPLPSTALLAPTSTIALPTRAVPRDFDTLIADATAAPAPPAAPIAAAVLLTVDPPPLSGLAPEIADPLPADPPSLPPELARPAPRQPRAATGKTLPPAPRPPRDAPALPGEAGEPRPVATNDGDAPTETPDEQPIAPTVDALALTPVPTDVSRPKTAPDARVEAVPAAPALPAEGTPLLAAAPAQAVSPPPVPAPAPGEPKSTPLGVSIPARRDDAVPASVAVALPDAMETTAPTLPVATAFAPRPPMTPTPTDGVARVLPAIPAMAQRPPVPALPEGGVSVVAVRSRLPVGASVAPLPAPSAAQSAPIAVPVPQAEQIHPAPPAAQPAPVALATSMATPSITPALAPPPAMPAAVSKPAAAPRGVSRTAALPDAPRIQRSAVPGALPSQATDRLLRARPNTAFAEVATPPEPATAALPGTAAPLTTAAPAEPSAASAQSIDTQTREWRVQMLDRIERFAAAEPVPGRETHIRLSPDALGEVAVRLKETDRGIEVVVDAAPEARALLTEAAPRLTELAESRGLRLTMGQPGAGEGGGDRPPPQPRQQADAPIPNRRAAQRGAADTPTDERIA